MAFADEYNWLLSSKERPVKYSSHDDFLRAISKSKDATPRSVYADWIEENEPHTATPETLALLRGSEPVWVSRGPDGIVRAGKKWTVADLKQKNREYAKLKGFDHTGWFDPGTMRFFGTRLHGDPYSGPGGVYLVYSGNDFYGTTRQHRIVKFNEDGSAETAEEDGHAYFDPFTSLAEARQVAQRLAARHPQPTE